jgi:hypothetical protein
MDAVTPVRATLIAVGIAWFIVHAARRHHLSLPTHRPAAERAGNFDDVDLVRL